MKILALPTVLLALFSAGAALASQPVVLRAAIQDQDGAVTLGELFDGAGAAAGVVVAQTRAGTSTVLDAGQVQRIAQIHGLEWDNEAGVRRIIVRPAEAAGQAGPSGSVQALTYTHNLMTGDIVGPDDLAWNKVVGAPLDAPRDADDMIGLAARRPLRAGAAVARRDVTAPQVIKRDDEVSVSYQADGISLTLQAKALQAAAVGEAFDVVNPASKKVIQAVCTGPGAASVGPGAERLRGADPRQLASLR